MLRIAVLCFLLRFTVAVAALVEGRRNPTLIKMTWPGQLHFSMLDAHMAQEPEQTMINCGKLATCRTLEEKSNLQRVFCIKVGCSGSIKKLVIYRGLFEFSQKIKKTIFHPERNRIFIYIHGF